MRSAVFLPTLLLLITSLLPPGIYSQCSRQTFVDSCLANSQPNIQACGTTDACLCTQLKVSAACYDQCPDDSDSVTKKQGILTEATNRCTGTNNSAPPPPPVSN